MSAFAYGTTYFSAVIFIGFAGNLGWNMGLNALWVGVGNAVLGALLAWLVLGKRTRRMTQKLNVMTMPEFLEARYGSAHLKMVSAVLIFVFLLPYSHIGVHVCGDDRDGRRHGNQTGYDL